METAPQTHGQNRTICPFLPVGLCPLRPDVRAIGWVTREITALAREAALNECCCKPQGWGLDGYCAVGRGAMGPAVSCAVNLTDPAFACRGISVRQKATEMLRCAEMMASANITHMRRYMALENSVY